MVSFFKNTFLLLFIPFSCFSQNPDDHITAGSLNEKYLEHLIKEKIDSVRLSHNLLPLYNDSILYVAAKHHAEYLFKKKELSHEELENVQFETPQKRADYFGAVNYLVGENVALTYINTPTKDKKGKVLTNQTYQQTATHFAVMWVNSKGHYKNIITPEYNATGVAISVDVSSNAIYAVQKFANILFKYQFVEAKNFFSYSNFKLPEVVKSFEGISSIEHAKKHAHKLKRPKKEKNCYACLINKPSFAFGLTGIEIKGDNIYLNSYSFDPILQLLKKRKDGFAAEVVVYQHYDCGNPEYYTFPSRRNGQCLFSGKVLKPVYKKKALKGFKPGGKKRKDIEKKINKDKVKKYSLKLGKIPKNISGYFEVNLVIIQNKKVCDVMHFSSFCGDTLKQFYSLPFLNNLISNNAELKEEYQTVNFSIPFLKNKTEYKIADIKPITDSLVSESFIADSIFINAFSSIEGSEEINARLQEQRARNIAGAISAQQSEKLITKIHVEENWTLFEKQLIDNKDLLAYNGLSKGQVKTKLNDTLEQSRIERYLSPQRVAKIKLHARYTVTTKNIEKYLTQRINRQRQKLNKFSSAKNDSLMLIVDELERLLDISYNHIKSGALHSDFLKQFDFGHPKYLNHFNLKKLQYWIQATNLDKENIVWRKKVYADLVKLYNSDEKSFFIVFNMLNMIQQYKTEIGVEIDNKLQDQYLLELMSYASNKEEKELVNKLALNFWFSLCFLPEKEQPKSEILLYRKCMNSIHSYFQNEKLSDEELNKLAKFYVYHNRADWAYELLWPVFEQKKNNPEGLKLLGKLLYQNYQEYRSEEYYTMLIKIYDLIGKDAWCPMFVGPCNISFQAFDNEFFKNFYCKKCSEYLNYAKAPINK